MSKKHYDYVKPIIEWAYEREIMTKGRLTKQLLKSEQENGELQEAIESYENGNKDALVEIKDAIGDVYVTLVVSMALYNEKHTHSVFKKIKPTIDGVVTLNWKYYISEAKNQDTLIFKVFTDEEKTINDIAARLSSYVTFLSMVASMYDLELVECIDYAYNTISKRTGKMIDGSFVKDK